MTITTTYGESSGTTCEGWRAHNTSGTGYTGWVNAANGGQTLVELSTESEFRTGGENYNSNAFYAFQTHQQINTTRDSGDRAVCAYTTWYNSGEYVSYDNWDLHILQHDNLYTTNTWVNTGDSGITTCGIIPDASETTSPSTPLIGGTVGLVGLVNASTTPTLNLATASSQQLNYDVPTDYYTNGHHLHYLRFYLGSHTGTSYDPRLTFTTMADSNAVGPGAAAVQLDDGSTMHVSWASDQASLTLYRRNASSDTTIASPTTSILAQAAGVALDAGAGPQVVAITRDADDNVYVLVGDGGSLYAQAFEKTATDTWTARTMLSQTLPVYDSETGAWPHNTVAAWHSTGGTAGTIVAVGHWACGAGDSATQWYALLNCDSLLAGSGTLFRGTGNATTLFNTPSVTAWTTYQNASGTGLDIAAGSATVGFAATYNRSGTVSYCAYTLASSGSSFSSVVKSTISDTIYQDADSKLRVLAYSSSVLVLAYGSQVKVRQLSGSSFVSVGTVNLSGQGMSTFPSAAAMLSTAAWDIAYDPVAAQLYYYYLDVGDGRRLMRTGIDTSTWLATQDEDEMDAAVGAAGSTNPYLRVHRGETTGYTTLITCFNVSSGGVNTNEFVEDTSQSPPSAPTLTPKQNFDGDDNADFVWTFVDPNSGDTQSAYQLQIATSGGVAEYDSTKTASGTSSHTLTGGTLANPGSWQFRVRTWDSADQAGPYSAYSSFQTAAGGNVTVTDPAADNPADLDTSSITITWEVTGTTQAKYRVVTTATATSAELEDTGWVTSTDVTYEVTGMTTDVEYQIAVTVRNGSDVESGTGLRLVTPSFGTPMTPTIVAVGDDDNALVTVSVTNPAPEGDRPSPTTNIIQRRITGSGSAFETIGSCDPDSSYADYTAASGVEYDYQAVATASQGSSTSDSDSDSTTFQGVWIHDPLDPSGTVYQFPYGKSSRTAGIDVVEQGRHYAGRTYPVVDWGEHQDDELSLRLDVPHGTDHATDMSTVRDFAEARRTLFVRDNRGRAVYAALSGYQEADQDWGIRVSLAARTVYYEVSV